MYITITNNPEVSVQGSGRESKIQIVNTIKTRQSNFNLQCDLKTKPNGINGSSNTKFPFKSKWLMLRKYEGMDQDTFIQSNSMALVVGSNNQGKKYRPKTSTKQICFDFDVMDVLSATDKKSLKGSNFVPRTTKSASPWSNAYSSTISKYLKYNTKQNKETFSASTSKPGHSVIPLPESIEIKELAGSNIIVDKALPSFVLSSKKIEFDELKNQEPCQPSPTYISFLQDLQLATNEFEEPKQPNSSISKNINLSICMPHSLNFVNLKGFINSPSPSEIFPMISSKKLDEDPPLKNSTTNSKRMNSNGTSAQATGNAIWNELAASLQNIEGWSSVQRDPLLVYHAFQSPGPLNYEDSIGKKLMDKSSIKTLASHIVPESMKNDVNEGKKTVSEETKSTFRYEQLTQKTVSWVKSVKNWWPWISEKYSAALEKRACKNVKNTIRKYKKKVHTRAEKKYKKVNVEEEEDIDRNVESNDNTSTAVKQNCNNQEKKRIERFKSQLEAVKDVRSSFKQGESAMPYGNTYPEQTNALRIPQKQNSERQLLIPSKAVVTPWMTELPQLSSKKSELTSAAIIQQLTQSKALSLVLPPLAKTSNPLPAGAIAVTGKAPGLRKHELRKNNHSVNTGSKSNNDVLRSINPRVEESIDCFIP